MKTIVTIITILLILTSIPNITVGLYNKPLDIPNPLIKHKSFHGKEFYIENIA